jgi:chromosome segregation ATPase
MATQFVVLVFFVLGRAAETSLSRPHTQDALLQTWTKSLDDTKETPISRVVRLLKEMGETLKKEMDEDEELYEKLACWCNNNKYEKNEAIEAAQAQIADLESKIEALTAKIAELKTTIAETTKELEADKEELATASALRQKQLTFPWRGVGCYPECRKPQGCYHCPWKASCCLSPDLPPWL